MNQIKFRIYLITYNSKILHEFLIYMKNNGSSERHQNNNLNVLIEFATFLTPHITLMISSILYQK
jgi:hypothetical protein